MCPERHRKLHALRLPRLRLVCRGGIEISISARRCPFQLIFAVLDCECSSERHRSESKRTSSRTSRRYLRRPTVARQAPRARVRPGPVRSRQGARHRAALRGKRQAGRGDAAARSATLRGSLQRRLRPETGGATVGSRGDAAAGKAATRPCLAAIGPGLAIRRSPSRLPTQIKTAGVRPQALRDVGPRPARGLRQPARGRGID